MCVMQCFIFRGDDLGEQIAYLTRYVDYFLYLLLISHAV